MPGASTITVQVGNDSSPIRAAPDNSPLDADSDGEPGGVFEYQFTTVSLAKLPGTSLIGVLADPGPDLKPGTIDDVQRGPDNLLMTADDVYLSPIAGATIFILGLEHEPVITDANGRFELPSIPSGNIKFAIDGRTATNAPDGIYFPKWSWTCTSSRA